MQKKLIGVASAILAAGIACTAGLTACNKGGGNSAVIPDVGDSVQVADAAEWKTVCENTLKLKNFSAVQEISQEGGGGHGISHAYGWGNNEQYFDEKFDEGYAGSVYALIEDETVYVAQYYDLEKTWYCDSESTDGIDNVMGTFDAMVEVFGWDDGDGFIDRFGEFEFSNGKYTASLNIDTEYTDYPTLVEIKIHKDGYLKYISVYNQGLRDIGEYKSELAVYNVGTTSFDGVPAAAKQAVEDFKNK
ncbi:MAG: hypothetical protein NC131_04160 [Roseburia sp.]|nr:hypothetical protein [Roseburia sp.]